MLLNYLKIAVRNLSRNKVYSVINILGLSLGVSCCLLLALYIQDEASYDKHQSRPEDLYRIITEFEMNGESNTMATTSPPIALTMRDEIPEIEAAVRILNPPGVTLNLIKYQDKLFYETNGFVADSSLFDVLTYGLQQGNPKKALVEANSVVISEALAKKLFDNDVALDKIITISQGAEAANYKVTGVFKELGKSFLKANFFTSMTSGGIGEQMRTDPTVANQWGGQNFVPAYVKLVPGHNIKEVTRRMNEVLNKYGAKDIESMGRKKTLSLERVSDIYLRSDVNQSPRIIYTYVIGSIAVFILLIACINFMNLSTAKATKRSSEIGIRKVMGAVRGSLIRQILGEAMVIVFIALFISIVLVQVTLPFFNELTGKSISYNTENVGFFVVALAGIAIVTGLVAGSYPAFYLSSFQPAEVLKGKFKMSNSSGMLRKSLVVFQFMIAITLVCGMLIISEQLSYMQEKDLGFNSDAKIILPLRTDEARSGYDPLKKLLSTESSIKAVAAVDYIPGNTVWTDSFFYPQGGKMETAIDIHRNSVDYGYIELIGIRMLAGRSFTDNREMESQGNVIVNETAARLLGFDTDNIVGEKIYSEWYGKKFQFTVVGVLEDYHQTGLKEEIKPMLFEISSSSKSYGFIVASVNTQNFRQTISGIESKWKSVVSDTPFEFSFLDDNLQQQYSEDQQVSSIIKCFTFIAMLISCLGLYGLSSYMAERRFKEIGVRKVMGASVQQIVTLMSREFIKLIAIAFLISVPLAWYAMNQWLQGFAYKVPINMWIFIFAGAGALTIALLTVSFESVKAAIINPVDSLRNE